MHYTAKLNCELFFSTYKKYFNDSTVKVIDIGSQDINGSLKEVCPKNFKYIGVDFQKGKNVDIILTDPYKLPFDDNSIDIVISSSCFEHSEMFWLSYLEILRILKPKGLLYLNVPSDGGIHREPVDCWRFYPDSGHALVNWSKRNGYNSTLLECYTQVGGSWHDYVAIFLKDEQYKKNFDDKIISSKKDFENGWSKDSDKLINPVDETQNERKIKSSKIIIFFRKIFLINLIFKLSRKLKKM